VQAARRLIEGMGHALAVIPPGKPELRRVLEGAGCEILETDRTARGMGASLAAGVEATASHEGWIVALGDMPRVGVATIAAVRAALESGAAIAAPFRGAQRGHPVGFAAALRAELLALDGDVGARALIERHGIRRIETSDAGILLDIDTAADLAAMAPPGTTGG